jgi:hypothetical protein
MRSPSKLRSAADRLAAWVYHCDEQQIDYRVLLQYEVSPGESPGGNRWHGWRPGEARWVNVLHVHSVDQAVVWIGKFGAVLCPSSELPGWEREICRRVEDMIDRSPAVRESAEAACRKELGWEDDDV